MHNALRNHSGWSLGEKFVHTRLSYNLSGLNGRYDQKYVKIDAKT
jgi:hypothetical protein